METKPSDLDAKYQKLATEYSKVRSQATVLKKAVLDEQARNVELKETVKRQEQTIRKHDQEMESLTFRNEQLTKRITVLQQELQIGSGVKKGKSKNPENVVQTDFGVLDEELQKKIMENAQLVSSMADKEFELTECKERNEWLGRKIDNIQKEMKEKDEFINNLNKQNYLLEKQLEDLNLVSHRENGENPKTNYWKEEAERWKTECELLRSKPESNEQLTEYYETQLREILESRQLFQSETNSLWAENGALKAQLENLIVENKKLQTQLDKSNEELLTTIENYKVQLDAMTEHLAAQNDKITKQCDEIQDLKVKSKK